MNKSINLSTIRKDVDRATGVIVRDGYVLLMHRRNRGKEYYTFPGGGIEKNETPEDAVIREVFEETSVEVNIDKLIYTALWDGSTKEYFYLCSYISGEPRLAADSIEKETMIKNSEQYYSPGWVPLSDLPGMLLYPLEIKDMFINDIKRYFAGRPRSIALSRNSVRQEL